MIGPANCEAALGVGWRWLRDHAEALGLTVLRVEGKPFVEASAALEAIRRHGAPEVEAASAEAEPETLESIRARLGMRRVGGSCSGKRPAPESGTAENQLNHSGSQVRRGGDR
jgi:hypothetical protein